MYLKLIFSFILKSFENGHSSSFYRHYTNNPLPCFASINQKTDNFEVYLSLRSYRLCVLASGSFMIVVFSRLKSIKLSFLHFGQYNGKFFNSVSSRTLLRVLFWQTGQNIHLLSNLIDNLHFFHI